MGKKKKVFAYLRSVGLNSNHDANERPSKSEFPIIIIIIMEQAAFSGSWIQVRIVLAHFKW